jgi:hypothetical protein
VQAGGSILRPCVLQCFFSILTMGSLATASVFAFFFYLLCASYSDILRTISKRAS